VLIRSIGVAVPAHNEEERVGACLQALRRATSKAGLPPARIVVVADDCTDATAAVARAAGVEVLEVAVRNAGAARAAGLDLIVTTTAVPLQELWLATTDADSRVPTDWLIGHSRWRADGWDAVAGTVVVEDWSAEQSRTATFFGRRYGTLRDDHPHVHGANLGLSGVAYGRVGGFPRLALSEDHALVAALTKCGLSVARTGGPPVSTSGRRDPRAREGFGAALLSMEEAAGAGSKDEAAPGTSLHSWEPFRP
jgi:glycosyltransferase involved in cell wall biosynthesis